MRQRPSRLRAVPIAVPDAIAGDHPGPDPSHVGDPARTIWRFAATTDTTLDAIETVERLAA